MLCPHGDHLILGNSLSSQPHSYPVGISWPSPSLSLLIGAKERGCLPPLLKKKRRKEKGKYGDRPHPCFCWLGFCAQEPQSFLWPRLTQGSTVPVWLCQDQLLALPVCGSHLKHSLLFILPHLCSHCPPHQGHVSQGQLRLVKSLLSLKSLSLSRLSQSSGLCDLSRTPNSS